jgi:phosphate uptake regulator
MIRKVIQQGPGTLMVSLPSKWVKKNGILKGQDINVMMKGNMLELATQNNGSRSVTLDLEGIDRTSLFHFLRFLYRIGVNEIVLRFSELYTHYNRWDKAIPMQEAINIEVNRLMGMEIIEQSEHSCTLKCMLSEDPEDFDKFLSKIFVIMNSAYDVLLELPEDNEDLIRIQNKHDQITRLISYCKRILNKFGFRKYEKTPYITSLLDSLELMIDIIEDVFKKTVYEKRKITKAILPVVKRLKKIFNGYSNLYYKYSIDKISKMDKSRIELETTIVKETKNMGRDDLLIIGELQVISAVIHRNLYPLSMSLHGT